MQIQQLFVVIVGLHTNITATSKKKQALRIYFSLSHFMHSFLQNSYSIKHSYNLTETLCD